MRKVQGLVVLSLLLIFSAVCLAEAQAGPNWVPYTVTWKLVRNKNAKQITSTNYYQLQATVTYKNNSRDRVITGIFNKTLTGTGELMDKPGPWVKSGTFKQTIKSSKYNKVELYPQQTTKLKYIFHLDQGTKWLRQAKFFNSNPRMVHLKLQHDFQVSSKKL